MSSGTIKIYSRTQVNKSNKNHYPVDDAEIVGDDRSVSKLAHFVVMLAGSGLKLHKGKGYVESKQTL